MTIEELRLVVRWLEDTRIGALEIESDDCRLRLVLQPDAVAMEKGEDRDGVVVVAEVPGAFKGPIVPLGGPVRAGDVVALVQIGLVYAPVTASTDGTLARILTEPHTLVGFGTPLLEIAYQ